MHYKFNRSKKKKKKKKTSIDLSVSVELVARWYESKLTISVLKGNAVSLNCFFVYSTSMITPYSYNANMFSKPMSMTYHHHLKQ